MSKDTTCPCGLPRPYAACCGQLHAGKKRADTPEELMRSRYAAYAKGVVDYIIKTTHPAKLAALNRKDLELNVRLIKWAGLTVVAVEGGTCFDTNGIVEFEARYTGLSDGVLRERSRFEKVDGVWFYLDGDVEGQGGP